MDTRDEIEAGADLCTSEINAAKEHLRARLREHEQLTGCTSYIQRKMGIGYNHGARIMSYLEACQFITPANAKGERRFR